jgi:hypothetical protein
MRVIVALFIPLAFGKVGGNIPFMTTLVTADEKGRIPIEGSKPGQKYLITVSGTEWRVIPFVKGEKPIKEKYPSRNRREWDGPKDGKSLAEHLQELGDLGLELEVSEEAKQPVPPCRF